jgi:hypothetical protein
LIERQQGFIGIIDVDESETPRPSFPVGNQLYRVHRSRLGEMFLHLRFGGVMGKISNIKIRHATFAFYRIAEEEMKEYSKRKKALFTIDMRRDKAFSLQGLLMARRYRAEKSR